MFRLLSLLLASVLATPLSADVLHLTDGSKLEGEISRSGNFWIIVDEEGEATYIGDDRVAAVEFTGRTVDEERAAARLRSLQRVVAHLDDIDAIVARYERFIEQNPDTDAVRQAREELQMWRQRRDEGLVRIGDEWVTPEQRTEIRDRVDATVEEAAGLIRSGQLRQAEALLAEALAEDPRNAALRFWLGVMHYRQDEPLPARRAFESVNQMRPEHGPTLNNLAVIHWRQNQFVAAMNYYNLAMRAAPVDRTILDNVAEALFALPERYENNARLVQARRRFIEQDEQLQRQMAREGLYRWGAGWVDQEEMQRLRDLEREIELRLDELSSEQIALQSRIAQIDRDLEDNHRGLRQIEATRWTRDIHGRIVRLGYPPVYFEIQQDIEHLKAERASIVRRLELLDREIERTQDTIHLPRYSGVQRLMDPEGAPVVR